MLNVMIIDDEEYIREGLKKIIDWNQYGFCVCGEASNGLKGLTKVCELNPDLVIVDVKMPVMDGLQMVNELRKKDCSCEFIILSAHSDFKHAQTAIQLGVNSYLLKPIGRLELIEKVCKVRDKIMDKKQTKEHMDISISLSRDKILQSMVLAQLDAQMLEKYYTLYGFNFPWSSYRIALIEIEGRHMEMATLKMSVKRQFEIIISENKLGYVFNIESYVGTLLDDMRLTADMQVFHDLPARISELCGADITISLGSAVENLADVSSSYQHARKLINRKFIMGYKRIIGVGIEEINITDEFKNTRPKYAVEYTVDSLCKAIDAENMKQINNILENILQEFLSGEYTEDVIKINYSNIYSAVVNKLASVNLSLQEKLNVRQEILTEICKKSSLQELHGYMKFIFTAISEELEKNRPDDPVKKILDYIERNYEQDLKLEAIAALFNYNSDYLGKRIKIKTGKHFNAYLDTVRLGKAKQFLKEGLKVYQVAQKTGFKDINYFYKKFKAYTGTSPSDYKDET